MLDLDGVIVPGKAAGGISFGSAVTEFLSLNHPQSTTQLADAEEHDFQAIKLWAKNGIVTQIGVYSGYRGILESQFASALPLRILRIVLLFPWKKMKRTI